MRRYRGDGRSWLSRIAHFAVGVGAWLGTLYITRWVMGVGKPRDDTRILRNVVQDIKWSWRNRGMLWHRWGVRFDWVSGVTDIRLNVLKWRILGGAYADDR